MNSNNISFEIEISTSRSEIVAYLSHTEIWWHVKDDLDTIVSQIIDGYLTFPTEPGFRFFEEFGTPEDYLQDIVDGYVATYISDNWDAIAEDRIKHHQNEIARLRGEQ